MLALLRPITYSEHRHDCITPKRKQACALHMSRLSLVRHGQASLFSDNYDRLSPLGERQSRVLAEHWLANGERFDEVYAGTLKRQVRTAECAGEAFREAGVEWPELQVLPGLDEYCADDVMGKLVPELKEREERFRRLSDEFDSAKEGRDRYRSFHRLLEAVMAVYVSGKYDCNGFETWPQFRDRVRDALRQVLERNSSGRRVAVFTSGGPIGVSVQTVLDAPEIKAAELNWRIHNCSLTELTFSPGRVTLDQFNSVPHFRDPELLTYRDDPYRFVPLFVPLSYPFCKLFVVRLYPFCTPFVPPFPWHFRCKSLACLTPFF